MKAILEFTLPEESYEYELASKSGCMAAFIADLNRWVRQEDKYGEKSLISYSDLRATLHKMMDESGVPEEAKF